MTATSADANALAEEADVDLAGEASAFVLGA
jgi:hypothetical protein